MQAEVLLGDLTRAGFKISDEHEGTDAVIVNTCAFIDDAKSESLQVRLLLLDFQAAATAQNYAS